MKEVCIMLFKKILPLLLILSMFTLLCGCAAGEPGKDGANGLSAYEIAVQNGFEGSETEWLASLAGKDAPSSVPTIGGNGNWWINGEDTGIKAEGNEIINNTLKDPTLEGKKIVCLGDDLFTENTGACIGSYIAELTGANVTTIGLPGATMSKNSRSKLNNFSMYRLADAMASKNYNSQNEAASTMDKVFGDAVKTLKSIHFEEVDMLIICFGLNDFQKDIPLSAADKDAENSYTAALAYSIEKICTKYTDLHVYVTTPMYSTAMDKSGNEATNKAGHTLRDYANAAVETARSYNIPAIDNYSSLGINKINLEYYYDSAESLVPNKNGMKLAARHIASKLF